MWSELDQKPLACQAGRGGAKSAEELAEIVVLERLHCYNQGLACDPAALRERLRAEGVEPLPSVRWIGDVLTRFGLTYRRTGWYEGEQLDWLPESAQVPPEKRCRVDIRRKAF